METCSVSGCNDPVRCNGTHGGEVSGMCQLHESRWRAGKRGKELTAPKHQSGTALTEEQVKERIRIVHGDDVVMISDYINAHTHSMFRCTKGLGHLDWPAKPNNVTRNWKLVEGKPLGSGCPECELDYKVVRKTEQFPLDYYIQKVDRETDGALRVIKRIEHDKPGAKFEFECCMDSSHPPFECQLAHALNLKEGGCPLCRFIFAGREYSFYIGKVLKPSLLNVRRAFKLGVCYRYRSRYHSEVRKKMERIFEIRFSDRSTARRFESACKRIFAYYRLNVTRKVASRVLTQGHGYTELFSCNFLDYQDFDDLLEEFKGQYRIVKGYE